MVKRWTEEEIQRLKELKSKGMTMLEVAVELNRPLNSVMTKAYLLGFVKRHTSRHSWTREEEDKIIKFMEQNTTVEEISEQLKLPRQTVINKIKHLGYAFKQINTASKMHKNYHKGDIRAKNKAIKELKRQNEILTKKIDELLQSVKELGLIQ